MDRLIAIALIFVAWAAGADQPGQVAPEGIEAFSRPSEDRALSFVHPGLVKEVLVVDGQAVQAGQSLLRLDDRAERIELEELKAQAEDTIRLDAAQANLDQAIVDSKQIAQAASKGAATDLEVQHAQLEVTIKQLSLRLERFSRRQDQRKYEKVKIMLDRMLLASPIGGHIQGIAVREGEAAEAYKPIIRIVQTDPLWVDVPIPLSQNPGGLKLGQAAQVAFPNADGSITRRIGKVTKIDSVADAAGGTLEVRIEVRNSPRRPAGEKVYVTFPPTPITQDKPATPVEAGKKSAPTTKPSKGAANG